MAHGLVAVIAPEIAIHQDLHVYGGGLGVVNGDLLRSGKKLGIPLVGFAPFWRYGYYEQHVEDRAMRVRFQTREYPGILEKTDLRFTVPINGTSVWLEVWKLPEERYGTSPVYFLDADVEGNDYLTRLNTQQLYAEGQNPERRIAVSQILGAGTFEAIHLLGLPVAKFHLQESHAAFAGIELFLSIFEREQNVERALADTRARVVFTTHTPVAAGNPFYDMNLVMRMCGYDGRVDRRLVEMIGADPTNPHMFNMAAACMRMAGKTNAVSKKHGEIARRMWSGLTLHTPITSITNGVSQDFWQYPEFRLARTPRALEDVKREYKRTLIRQIGDADGGRYFSENVLTVVWARRFAEYKRPKLVLTDREWVTEALKKNTIQLIIAGKPHPDDYEMIGVWNELYQMSVNLPNMVVLSGYELELSKVLKAGADVWLNNPRSPDEACGTSGMSAAMNGAIHMSTRDGWALEQNPANCFLFGAVWPPPLAPGPWSEEICRWQDAYDAQELKRALETACRMFYSNRIDWYRKALAAKHEAEERWCSDRMAREYSANMYEG